MLSVPSKTLAEIQVVLSSLPTVKNCFECIDINECHAFEPAFGIQSDLAALHERIQDSFERVSFVLLFLLH
jgi:hypothetical protein